MVRGYIYIYIAQYPNLTDSDILNHIKNVDGSGSGLDADLLIDIKAIIW